METPAERERRIAELEAARAERRAGTAIWPTPDDAGLSNIPVEIARGRGDLNYSSGHIPQIPTALMLVNSTVSFARLFQTQPWVASAVMRMLTWAIRVPLRCYRKDSDPNHREAIAPDEHPLAAALAAPWNRAGQAQLIQAMLGPMMVHGNSVIEVLSGARDKIEFSAKDWRFSQPIMPWRDSLEGFVFDVDTPEYKRNVSIDDILHTCWWSPTGPIGTSPLQQLGVTLNIEDAAQRYQRAMFQNGARPPSAITASEEFLSLDSVERKQIMDQLRADIINLYGGPDNAGKPALLPPGLDWKEIEGGTAVEAALIDQRKITREEIAAVYLIPPPLLGILDRATYSNIQVQRDMTYTDCLGPPLVLCEQAVNSQIVRELLQEDDIFVEFDFAAVLRGDRLQEIEMLRNGVSTGMISPNESRGVLGFPRVDDDAMDEFYMPTVNNLQAVTGDEAEARRQAAIKMAEQGRLPTQQNPGGGRKPGQPADPPPGPGAPAGDPSQAPTEGPRGSHLHVRSRERDYTKEVVVR